MVGLGARKESLGEPALHLKEPAVVLISLERVDLQRLEPLGRTVKEFAIVCDLLEEQRIGSIDQREIELAIGEERLKALEEFHAFFKRNIRPIQQDG
jgi:hypothetical protein